MRIFDLRPHAGLSRAQQLPRDGDGLVPRPPSPGCYSVLLLRYLTTAKEEMKVCGA